MNIPVSMVTAADTPIFREKKVFLFVFSLGIAMPDNRGSEGPVLRFKFFTESMNP